MSSCFVCLCDKNGPFVSSGRDDVLVGSTSGSDVFRFETHAGNDEVVGFIAGSGANQDLVRLSDYGLYTFNQVLSAMTQVGSNAVLKLDANDSITFQNTQVSQFTASNFQLPLDISQYHLSFDDEFNTLSLQTQDAAATGTWSTAYNTNGRDPYGELAVHTFSGYTGEQEIYVDPLYSGSGASPLGLNPFSLTNGIVSITAAPTPTADLTALYNYQYYSGLLTTENTFSQTYGYFEIRAQLPSGAGAWPAFWLLPVNGERPPEFDVFETTGTSPDIVKMTAHDDALPNGKSTDGIFIPTATSAFHTYGLLWDPQHLTWYIDGQQVYQIATPADMNTAMYLVLNLAVGAEGGTPDPNNMPSPFEIDYVRVYGLSGPTAAPTSTTVGAADATVTLTSAVNTAIDAGLGGDTINGGAGFTSKVAYSGKEAQYQVFSDGSGGYYVENSALGSNPATFDHLTSITTLQFSDQSAAPSALSVGQLATVSTAATSISLTNGTNIVIDAGLGGDSINGGSGSTTVVYSGSEAQYVVYTDGSGGFYVQNEALGPSPTALDHLINVANLQFADQTVAPGKLAVGEALQAGAGPVTLTGSGGSDLLIGGSSADTMIGGGGLDTFYVNNPGDVVKETTGQATVYVSASSWVATSGSTFSEVLTLGNANIKLVGNGTSMTILSNTGIDTLDDAGGAVTLVGNGAVDNFIVRNAATVVEALAGSHDTVQTTLSSYTLPANVANLTYIGTGSFYGVGGSLGGTLTGGPGPDTLVSGTGAEVLIGGASNNTFYVNNAADIVSAPAVSNSVEFSSVSGVKAAVNVSELAFTGTGNDIGYGNSTAVLLLGNSAADTLIGGSGNDTLDGGLGADVLTGGSGTNLFRFDGLSGGVDKITNYVSTQDHIGLSASGFGLSSLSSVSFEFGTSLTPVAGHANILYNTTTGALSYDAVGGDGHIVQIATLTTHPALSSSDFVLS